MCVAIGSWVNGSPSQLRQHGENDRQKYNSNPGFLDAPPLSLSRNKIIWIFEGENIKKKQARLHNDC